MADRFGTYGNQDVEAWRRIPTRDEPKMEAEPSFLEKLARSIANDPTAGASPNTLAGLSMKNPENASKLMELIQKYLPEGATAPQRAIAYAKAKYPLLSKRMSFMESMRMPKDEFSETHGQYYPTLHHLPEGMNRGIGISEKLSEAQGVRALGHELTHGVQDLRAKRVPEQPNFDWEKHFSEGVPDLGARQPMPPTVPSMSGPGLGRSTVSPFAPETGKDPGTALYGVADKVYGYEANPFEKQAVQGGAGALNTYKKFKAQLLADELSKYSARPKVASLAQE